jgi:outer membrane protein
MNGRIALTLTLLLGAPLSAQNPPAVAPAQTGSRLAWVNFQQVVATMPEYAAAESLLTNELASARQEVLRLQNQLDSMTTVFEQQQIALSPSARQQRQQELREIGNRYQQRALELENAYTQREREVLAPLEQRARAVVEGLRAERNLLFVFDVSAPGSNILTADRTLDLTTVAIERLRAQ